MHRANRAYLRRHSCALACTFAINPNVPLPPQLQERIATHEKERRAIQTIMEQKIKALTDAIATVAVADLTSPAAGQRNLQRLIHEVHALQRLVNASIAALRSVGVGRGSALVRLCLSRLLECAA